MATGIIVLDSYTIYYDGRYGNFKAKPLYSSATERKAIVFRQPYYTDRKTVKPIAYILKTTSRWHYVNVYQPPSTDRYITYNKVQLNSSIRKVYYNIDTAVRYCTFKSYDSRPPVIIGSPKFLNWKEIPRTYYFKADIYSPYPIVPETVLISLYRKDKNEILNYSLETTPDNIKIYPDTKRKDVYIIECHFGIIFDEGENIEIGIDIQNEYGASLNGTL